MAIVALNKFLTIRHDLTTVNTGIYTCPVGVAGIIISAQIANVSTGTTTYLTTFSHYRPGNFVGVGGTFNLVKDAPIPVRDALNPILGRLTLETDDEIHVSANENGVLKLTMSVLETAKGW